MIQSYYSTITFRTINKILLVITGNHIQFLPQIGDHVDLQDGNFYKVQTIEHCIKEKQVYIVLEPFFNLPSIKE